MESNKEYSPMSLRFKKLNPYTTRDDEEEADEYIITAEDGPDGHIRIKHYSGFVIPPEKITTDSGHRIGGENDWFNSWQVDRKAKDTTKGVVDISYENIDFFINCLNAIKTVMVKDHWKKNYQENSKQ